jgi:hypothetical protein
VVESGVELDDAGGTMLEVRAEGKDGERRVSVGVTISLLLVFVLGGEAPEVFSIEA